MISITCPDGFRPEKTYIFSVIFDQFLGCPYQLTFTQGPKDYCLEWGGKKIWIQDAFFGRLSEDKKPLYTADLVPQKIEFVQTGYAPDQHLPVIYGTSHMDTQSDEWQIGLDLVGSVFFMLTRWEEAVCSDRDHHDRFPATASLAFRCGFLDRAVVNEWVVFLGNLLEAVAPIDKKQHQFSKMITHDVDHWFCYGSLNRVARRLGRQLIKKRSFGGFLNEFKTWTQVGTGQIQDPYDRYSYLMDVSEAHGVRSHFFILGGGRSAYDNPSDLGHPKIQRVFESILNRGHKIGIHPSYEASFDSDLFDKEKQAIEKFSGQPITEGRNHFLRFSVPDSWAMYAKNRIRHDSTLGYPEMPGFRTGCCWPYPVFNFKTRSELPVVEHPLIFMEGSAYEYQNWSKKQIVKVAEGLKQTVQKFGGEFVVLWHNSSFSGPIYQGSRDVYEKLVE